MKKIRVCILILLSISLVGCSNPVSYVKPVEVDEADVIAVETTLRDDIFETLLGDEDDYIYYPYEDIVQFFVDKGYKKLGDSYNLNVYKYIENVGTFAVFIEYRNSCECARVNFALAEWYYEDYSNDYNDNGYIDIIKFNNIFMPGGAVEIVYKIKYDKLNSYDYNYSFITNKYRYGATTNDAMYLKYLEDISDSMDDNVKLFTSEINKLFDVDLNEVVFTKYE